MEKDNSLRVKISIADRIYPLTIQYEQEEALRIAAKKIEKTIKEFEENYSVRDKQDLLAMCALEFASQEEQKKINQTNDKLETINFLKEIEKDLDSVL